MRQGEWIEKEHLLSLETPLEIMERQIKIKRGALFISSGETPPLIDKSLYSQVNRYASMDV